MLAYAKVVRLNQNDMYAYSVMHGFWLVEELAELADGPTGCGEMIKGRCLFANCTCRGREKGQIKHHTIAELVTCS